MLTRLGFVSEQALAHAIAEAAGLPLAQPDDYPQAPVDEGRVSPRFLRDAKAVPLHVGGSSVDVAFVDPFDAFTVAGARHGVRSACPPGGWARRRH